MPYPPDYKPSTDIDYILFHELRWFAVRTVCLRRWEMLKVCLREDFYQLYGESVEDLERRQLEQWKEALRLELESRFLSKSGRDTLTREEQVQIAEEIASRMSTTVEATIRNLRDMDEKKVKEFSKTYLNVVKECVDEFVSGFDAGKSREIRAYILQEASEEEFEALRRRALEEHGVQLDTREELAQHFEMDPGVEMDVRAMMRRAKQTDLSEEATEQRLDSAIASADSMLGRARAILSAGARSAEEGGERKEDPLSRWLGGVQARLRGVDRKQAAKAFADTVEGAKERADRLRGVTTEDAERLARESAGKAREAWEEQNAVRRGWGRLRSSFSKLYRGAKESYVKGDTGALREASREEWESAQRSAQEMKEKVEESSWLHRAKEKAEHLTGLDRTPEEIAEEERREQEVRRRRSEEWSDAFSSWSGAARDRLRSTIRKDEPEADASGETHTDEKGAGEREKQHRGDERNKERKQSPPSDPER